jgi:RNA-directed DNA polymerase
MQFLSIAHLLTPEALMEAFKSLRKDASAGVDGVAYDEYRMEAEKKIQELYERVKAKRYRAQPLRRIYINHPSKIHTPNASSALFAESVSII